MESSIDRNKVNARRIESWLLNRIALIGGNNVAKAVGVDKAQISRWKESWLPKMAMLLAVLEWGVVDDDIARVSKLVALYLEENILTSVRKKNRPAATERSEQITMGF
ncbi:CII family transcriptional regulator [Klebsiella sp. NPDC088457]